MTPTAGELIADLAAAFPLDNVRPATLDVYKAKLADVPPHLLNEVIHDLICTCERFPKIAQIRAGVAERVAELPNETEALAQIEARLRWRLTEVGEPPFVHPAVKEALGHVGGMSAFRGTEEPTILRGQFARYYREIRAGRIRTLQVGAAPEQAALERKPQSAVS